MTDEVYRLEKSNIFIARQIGIIDIKEALRRLVELDNKAGGLVTSPETNDRGEKR